MDPLGTATIAGSIVAIIEFLKRTLPFELKGNAIILTGAILGAIAGLLGLYGLDLTAGIALGLATVGTHTILKPETKIEVDDKSLKVTQK